MIKVVIVEDEMPAAELLVRELEYYHEAISVERILTSAKEAITFFGENPHVDLVFMDINLSDGQSFSIFENVEVNSPVIFITGYDQYMLDAFRNNGIAYLLKPLERSLLMSALAKYSGLKRQLNADILQVVKQAGLTRNKKTVLVVKKGIENCLLKTSEIAYFFSDNKIVFAVDANCKKYLVEGLNLTELMFELDQALFYRVNRKYIINIHFIKKYRTVDRVKLVFDLNIPVSEELIMSQENAKLFRRWIKSV
jgi:DNA-binding LytR/AlgR family response regulator